MCRSYLRATEWISGPINNCRNQRADEIEVHWCRQRSVGSSAHCKELLNTSLNAAFRISMKTYTTPMRRPRQSVRTPFSLSLSLSLSLSFALYWWPNNFSDFNKIPGTVLHRKMASHNQCRHIRSMTIILFCRS